MEWNGGKFWSGKRTCSLLITSGILWSGVLKGSILWSGVLEQSYRVESNFGVAFFDYKVLQIQFRHHVCVCVRACVHARVCVAKFM